MPEHRPGEAVATRLEYRAPDSACNPYLMFAGVLAAGLEGIDRGTALPAPVDRLVGEMSAEERATRNVQALPSSLGEAIEAFAGSDLLRATFGEHVFETLLENKRLEWDDYRSQVTPYEIDRYLGSL